MENTQHPLLTTPSLLVQLKTSLRHSFGNLGCHPNANSLAGLRFRIEFGPQIDWKLGDGQTKELAHYVDSMQRQVQGLHLFRDCRFMKHLWKEISTWAQNSYLHPSAWPPSNTTEEWWTSISNAPSTSRKGLRSLIILVCWEVWKERNARVFEHRESTNFVVLQRIKDEARLWIKAPFYMHPTTSPTFSPLVFELLFPCFVCLFVFCFF